MNRQGVLFDLDGTLTDPAEGIIGGVVFAMEQAGVPVPDRATLESFIGPPLIGQFERVCGVPHETAVAMLGYYRQYFVPRGMHENRVYDGIPALLTALRAAGLTLAVATSKPEPFAEEILTFFGLADKLDYICGSTLDEQRTDKASVIAYARERMGFGEADALMMVGDRCYDVEGAVQNGLPCIGVLYGYGSREELTAAGAAALAQDPQELQEQLLRWQESRSVAAGGS